MKRQIIRPAGPQSSAPLSPAVKIGNLLFTSGQVGIDREKGEIPENIKKQTKLCFENLRKVLREAGTDFENVVKVNVYLTDIDDFESMNEVYKEYFPSEFPARTAIDIDRLANPKLKIEIELVAIVEGCENNE